MGNRVRDWQLFREISLRWHCRATACTHRLDCEAETECLTVADVPDANEEEHQGPCEHDTVLGVVPPFPQLNAAVGEEAIVGPLESADGAKLQNTEGCDLPTGLEDRSGMAKLDEDEGEVVGLHACGSEVQGAEGRVGKVVDRPFEDVVRSQALAETKGVRGPPRSAAESGERLRGYPWQECSRASDVDSCQQR